MLFGNKIKSLRDEQGVLQRQLAAYLEIDTPMFSKIERGDRRAKRSQVLKMVLINECKMKIKSIVSCGFSLKNMYFCNKQYN